MLIGYTDEMTDKQISELGDWADHHARSTPTREWKRAYALIREGSDLLLRRRAGHDNDPEFEPPVVEKSPYVDTVGGVPLQVVPLSYEQCQGTYNGNYCAEHNSSRPHDNMGRHIRFTSATKFQII